MHQHDLIGKELANNAQKSPADQIALGDTGYDDVALASYQDFLKLRNDGVIKSGVRFQVSLPTPINVVAKFATPEYQSRAEVAYEEKLLRALRRIQDTIPAKDLAIQWDIAVEFAMLENLGRFFCTVVLPSQRRLSASVDESVQLGYHLCYGDKDHKHFIQPKDTGLLVDMANSLSESVRRPIQWIQMPVPKDRMDEEYFLPLRDLKLDEETDVYLGLVHPYDLEGTRKRIEVARTSMGKFGIATECGLGRAPVEEFESVLGILAEVMGPNA